MCDRKDLLTSSEYTNQTLYWSSKRQGGKARPKSCALLQQVRSGLSSVQMSPQLNICVILVAQFVLSCVKDFYWLLLLVLLLLLLLLLGRNNVLSGPLFSDILCESGTLFSNWYTPNWKKRCSVKSKYYEGFLGSGDLAISGTVEIILTQDTKIYSKTFLGMKIFHISNINTWNWVASVSVMSSQNSILSRRSWLILCTRQRFINQVYRLVPSRYLWFWGKGREDWILLRRAGWHGKGRRKNSDWQISYQHGGLSPRKFFFTRGKWCHKWG